MKVNSYHKLLAAVSFFACEPEMIHYVSRPLQQNGILFFLGNLNFEQSKMKDEAIKKSWHIYVNLWEKFLIILLMTKYLIRNVLNDP